MDGSCYLLKNFHQSLSAPILVVLSCAMQEIPSGLLLPEESHPGHLAPGLALMGSQAQSSGKSVSELHCLDSGELAMIAC